MGRRGHRPPPRHLALAMTIREVVVSFETLEIEHGIWCDACALSSAHRVWFTVTMNGNTRLESRVVCESHR